MNLIYTDGSLQISRKVSDEPAGSWAYVWVKRNAPIRMHNEGEVLCWSSGYVVLDPLAEQFIGAIRISSNTAELSAIYWALFALNKKGIKKAVIFSDSKYSVNTATGEYSIRKNKQLILSVRDLLYAKGKKYSLRWAKGHVGLKFNEMADRLAKAQSNG